LEVAAACAQHRPREIEEVEAGIPGREPATESTGPGSHLEAPPGGPDEVPVEEPLDELLTVLTRDVPPVPRPLPRDPVGPEMAEEVSMPFPGPRAAGPGRARRGP
jgi:hypothetical protein